LASFKIFRKLGCYRGPGRDWVCRDRTIAFEAGDGGKEAIQYM
jgi:hypothetical protein